MKRTTHDDFLAQRERQTTIDALGGPLQPACREVVPSSGGVYSHQRWVCTRPLGHVGMHVAAAFPPETENGRYADYLSHGEPHVAWEDDSVPYLFFRAYRNVLR